MNLTKKQIEIIKNHTPKELRGKSLSLWDFLGYFTPAGANWSYRVGYVQYKKIYVLVVTRFGQVL